MGELCSGDRFKFILNTAVINFWAGNNDPHLHRLIRDQVIELFAAAKCFCFDDLPFFSNKWNNSHRNQSITTFYWVVVGQSGNSDVSNAIDGVKEWFIDAKHSRLISQQLYLAFWNGTIMGSGHSGHLAQSACSIFLMDFACLLFPDKYMLFSYVQKLWNVFFGDYMTTFKGSAFKSIIHCSNIMA